MRVDKFIESLGKYAADVEIPASLVEPILAIAMRENQLLVGLRLDAIVVNRLVEAIKLARGLNGIEPPQREQIEDVLRAALTGGKD